MKTSFTLLAISIIDYSYQKWQFLEDQKMTKHEEKRLLKKYAQADEPAESPLAAALKAAMKQD